jgi:hypothetical protein
MDAHQSQQSYAFSMAPIMKMYMDSFEAWKHNYDAFTAGAKDYTGQHTSYSSNTAKPAFDTAFTGWQKSGEELFRRFVEHQIELCRFFASRWENYLKLPDQLAHCQSPAEMGQVQAAFFTQFASDYMQEASKLSQAVGELMSHWAAPRHV